MGFAYPNFTFFKNLTLSFTVLNANVQCSEGLLRSVESTLLLDQKVTRPPKELAEQDEKFAENKTTCLDRLKGLEVARKCMHQFTFRTALL
jgi:hypothetical protein